MLPVAVLVLLPWARAGAQNGPFADCRPMPSDTTLRATLTSGFIPMPDGTRIAFYSNRTGGYRAWVINPDGSGLKPLTVSFTDSSTGTITNRFWDFGDGSTTNTSATSFSHTYLNGSTNTVALTVTGPVGTNTLTQAGYIAATNLPPQLSLSPASLAFGPVIIGQTNTLNFQLVNTGDLTLSGTVAASSPFTIQSGSPFTILARQTSSVAISFAPLSAVNFSNVVTFTSNGS